MAASTSAAACTAPPSWSPTSPLPIGYSIRRTVGGLYIRRNTTDKGVSDHVRDEYVTLLTEINRGSFSINAALDGGANAGYSSVAFARALPKARIVALEPHPDNYAMLRQNALSYSNIVPLQAALWSDSGGPPPMVNVVRGTFDGREWNMMVSNSNAQQWAIRRVRQKHDNNVAGKHEATAPALSIPLLLRQLCIQRFDLIKLDIEGAEHTVIPVAAAREGLRIGWLADASFVYIETHPQLHLPRKGPDQVLESDVVGALWAHNFTVIAAFARRVFWEHSYVACAGRQMSAEQCKALCLRWRKNEEMCRVMGKLKPWRRAVQ